MLKSIIRALAFTSNWTALVARQPSMLLTMIGGPFLILVLFGIGIVPVEPPPETIVVKQESTATSPFEVVPQDFSAYLNIVEVTDDLDHAMAELRAQKIRLVVLLPEMPLETILNGERAFVTMYINEVNPIRLAFIRIDVRAQMAVVNREFEARVIEAAKVEVQELKPQLTQIEEMLLASGASTESIGQLLRAIDLILELPTDVLVEPFDAEIENISPIPPTAITYFTPAGLALIIQHLAVTLAALSMVRARLFGMIELWWVAPVRLGEIIAGNYFSYGLLTLLTSAVLVTAVIWALSIPVLGPLALMALGIVLLVFASLGIGFVISLAAHSEQTAAQLSMIILLASIFLGGLLQPLEAISFPVRAVSYTLPATYGAQILQSIMIRGQQGETIHYLALGLIAFLGLIATIWLFRRELRPR